MKKMIFCLIGLTAFIQNASADNTQEVIEAWRYANCRAGQLLDICNNVSYWKVQQDCNDLNSPYVIVSEEVSKYNSKFYNQIEYNFDELPYHCLLKAEYKNVPMSVRWASSQALTEEITKHFVEAFK